jgi:hypothetical protein
MSRIGRISKAISILSLGVLLACAPPPKAPPAATSNAWFAILVDDTSDWQVKLRPRDLAQDPVFGPVLRRAEREAAAAIAQARLGETTLQALEQSEAILFAVRRAKPLDAVLIVGGVPASTSPDAMVDDHGRPLWHHVDAPGRSIQEYTSVNSGGPDAPPTRLVALPGRTWIVATGGAVDRMATALSIPSPAPYRPDAPTDGRDLAEILVVGELLAPLKSSRGELLQPLLAPLTQVSLRVDGGHAPAAHLLLTYRDEPAALHAEDFLQTLKTVFATKYPKFQGLIDAAKVTRHGREITVDSAIPGGLVHMLLEAGRAPRSDSPVADPNTL